MHFADSIASALSKTRHDALRFRFIFSFRNGIKLFTNNVTLHDFAVLIDTK